MSIIVQKFGGSSVANKNKLEFVCNKIIHSVDEDNSIVVVVSAQGKTTDNLIEKAEEYGGKIETREMDLFISTGEIQTVALLCMMLKNKGYDAVPFSGIDAGILTNSNFGRAMIKSVYTEKIKRELKNNKIVVVAGFQGNDRNGSITTLGRGGSDLTAVALAKALEAERCETYTDVDGIYSGDPRIINKAILLKEITYDEMLELATAGAKVLHNRSVSIAKDYGIDLMVSNTMNDIEGTRVVSAYFEESKRIAKVTKKDNISMISIVGQDFISKPEKIKDIIDLLVEEGYVIHQIEFGEIIVKIVVDKIYAEEIMIKLHDRLNNI